MTGAEANLWEMLRGRRFDGLKFRRQAPVAGFVADFLCPELKLVIELDGGVHALTEGADIARDERITAAGYEVLRFENQAFLSNPAVVLAEIRRRAADVRREGGPPPRAAAPSASGTGSAAR